MTPNPVPTLTSAFSRAVFMGLRREVGANPRALDILVIFEDLRQKYVAVASADGVVDDFDVSIDEGTDSELANRFRIAYSLVSKDIKRNDLFDIVEQQYRLLLPLIRRVGNPNAVIPLTLWRQVANNYAELLRAFLADKKVFTTITFVNLPNLRWPQLRLASPKQEAVEKLKYDDPDLYARTLKSQEQVKKLTAKIKNRIVKDGLTPTRANVFGRVVMVGQDPATSERIVYDIDGSRTPIDEYFAKIRESNKQYQEEARINPKSLKDLDSMRALPPNMIEQLSDVPVDQIRYVSLTDDPLKDSALTRLYPVVEINGTDYVQSGRFKGFALPDLVNVAGRQIEGSVYYYDSDSQRITRRENPKGTAIEKLIRAEQEPYITLIKHKGKQKLLIRLHSTRGRDPKDPVALKEKKIKGAAREAVDKLSLIQPTIIKVKNDLGNLFMFDAKDFTAIKKRVGGVAMSNAAARFLKAYFDDLLRAQQAADSEDLARFDELGMRRPLWHFQKKALAWLEANGDRGVCALDTGLGKCVRGDTLVSTTKGLVEIQDLVPKGLAPDTSIPAVDTFVRVGGETLPIKNYYYGGEKPTLAITTNRGFEIEGSLVHPLFVRNQDGESFLKTSEISAGDYLCVERNGHVFSDVEPDLDVPTRGDFSRHANKLTVYQVPDRMNPDLARLLGYIVAEGYTALESGFTVSQCPEQNPEVRADIDSLLKSQFGWVDTQSVKDTRVSSKFLRVCLERMGVDYTLSKDKRVPSAIMRSTRESVIQFLKGLIDAEGSFGPSSIEFSTASETMAREVQLLLLHLGIMSTRTTKKVKGYDHTYWRVVWCGDDARRYAEIVGAVSTRKIASLKSFSDSTSNPNLDVVPFMAESVDALRADIQHKVPSGFVRRFGRTFINTLQHIRLGRRNPTYAFLRKMLDIAVSVGADTTPSFLYVKEVCDRNYFYDPVKTVVSGFKPVYDIEVDSPDHKFIGNGLVNHNTTVAIATIRNLQMRMNQGEEISGNRRFLFVCEKSLLGNFAKEVTANLSDDKGSYDAANILERTDVVTYAMFLKNRKEDPTYGDDYTAIFFDEAHLHLIKRSSAKYKAATAVKCERKVILSASPIVNTPRDIYTMASVTNGVDLNTKEGRTEERLFINRFAKKVGNRIVGVTDDPDLEEDMRSWVKRNLYYGDKRDTRDETGLPELMVAPSATLTMDPQVEVVYRQTMDQLLKELKTVANKGVRGNQPVAVETSRVKLAKLIALLSKLSDVPEEIVPGASNPKLEQSNAILRDRLTSKTIFFGDSIPLVQRAFQNFVDAYPMRAHALALSDQIIFRDAMGKETVYRQKAYTDPDTGLKAKPAEWATIILKQIQRDSTLLTLTLSGKYAVGQNLQAFSAVVHLDRDSWSSETMKQRTARAWRSGQRQPVTEFTMDTVYSKPRANAKDDMTLDQIRRYMQEMDSALFDSIIKDSKTFVLGETWTNIERQRSGTYSLDRKMLERALSPYATQLGKQGGP